MKHASAIEVGWRQAIRSAWNKYVYLIEVSARSRQIVHRFNRADCSPELICKHIGDLQGRATCEGRKGTEYLIVIGAKNSSGFDILLSVGASGVVADFGGLVQDFESLQSAMVWVQRALNGSYRLRVYKVGGLAREWVLEPATEEQNCWDILAAGQGTYALSRRSWEQELRQNGGDK